MKKIITGITFLLLSLMASWLGADVNAQSVVFSDDFSDDLEKWQPVRDVGQFWNITNGQVIVTIPTASTITELVPKDHYWDSRWQDYQFEFDFTPLAGVDVNFLFGFQDACNWYETHFAAGAVDLVRLLDCAVIFDKRTFFDLPLNQTYHITISFHQGHIFTYVDQKLLFDEIDWSFNHNYGRIGLKAGTGSVFPTQVAFDNVKVSLLDQSLGVPLLKQTDPRWSEYQYDSAADWSETPTIGNWGCALVSMVMILHHHGIQTFATGLPITPLSLNEWLNSQPDGYIGDGLLNWLAITRLTREISQVLQTPKLEYRPFVANLFSQAATEISHQKPVILQIDGHFLVADGVNQTGTDLLIKDPAYTHTYFSQHQSELLSIRTFEPSQTDLSYLMVTFEPQIEVKLINITQPETVLSISILEDLKSLDSPQSKSNPWKQLLIPKPLAGTYEIAISQALLGPFSVDVYVYDQLGNPVKFEIDGIVGQKPKTYRLTYSLASVPELTTNSSWYDFRQSIYAVQQLNGFWTWPVYWLLEWTAYQAEINQFSFQPEIIKVLALQLSSYRPWISASGYGYLTQELNSLGSE